MSDGRNPSGMRFPHERTRRALHAPWAQKWLVRWATRMAAAVGGAALGLMVAAWKIEHTMTHLPTRYSSTPVLFLLDKEANQLVGLSIIALGGWPLLLLLASRLAGRRRAAIAVMCLVTAMLLIVAGVGQLQGWLQTVMLGVS